MASPSPDLDIEAQTNNSTVTWPEINLESPPSANPQLSTTPEPPVQHTSTSQHHYENAARKITDNSRVERDEKYGDSSDEFWLMYLTEAEKQDKEVTESWKGDTDGILVFTGLFSATVAAFIIESYQNLSPDSGDTTNALLAQISQQLVNISHGAPLTIVTAQSNQPFKPTASAVRVNVLWFLSLVLSLSCALSATLMQQWARRYRELAQRRGAFHRRGRMRAYIFDGISRFGMARAVATMPTLLHISVFLFFAGLVDFLFPIHATVAYTTLGCITFFALAYAILTILPNIYHSCPYATPLSGFTWRMSHLAVIGFLWTTLKIEGAFSKSLSQLWSLFDQPTPEPDGLNSWRKTLKNQVQIRRQWLSQGMRKSIEFSAYKADSTIVTSALECTLTALEEERELEDFSSRVPGFFDSSVVSDATLAILPLMSHQPNSEPILGSRLYDLLKSCKPESSSLDEEMRNNRLRACLKCLWSFAKAYNQVEPSQALPSYFPYALASPEITRLFQAEKDSGVRVIGRCYGALIVNKLVTDLESRADSISDQELACLSAILGDNSHDVKLFLCQPGAVTLMNLISLTSDDMDCLVTDTVLSCVWDVVQQTFDILFQAVSSPEAANVQLDRPSTIIKRSGPSGGNFGCILESRLLDLLDTCLQVTSPIEERVRTSCLRMCLKGLWYFGRTSNQLENSTLLPSFNFALTNPEMIRRIHEKHDLTVRVIGRCVQALVVNKLATDFKSRSITVSDDELVCLSDILGIKSHDAMLLLSHPGAIEFTNIIFLALDHFVCGSTRISSDVPDVLQETLGILSRALPADLNIAIPLHQTDTRMNVPEGAPSLAAEMYKSVLHVWMRILWPFARKFNESRNSAHLPSYVCISFTNQEMTKRIREEPDPAVRVIGRCVEALIVNKLAVDMKSSDRQVTDDGLKLDCLSALLGTKSDDVTLLLNHPGAAGFTKMVFLALNNSHSFFTQDSVPSAILKMVQDTFGILSQALPPEWNDAMSLDLTDALMNVSDEVSPVTDTAYTSFFRLWMKNLWSFVRDCHEGGNSVPLPSYFCIAFTNPEMTRRIHEECDLAVRVIGRCVGALVVSKLVVDIKSRPRSRRIPVSRDELACLSAVLGTNGDNVKLLLDNPGAIELTNMAFLALDDFYSLTLENAPLYVLNAIQETFSLLSRALPPGLSAEMREIQTDSVMKVLDGTSFFTAAMYRNILRLWMKTLWSFTIACNEPWYSFALPSYVCVTFTNPEMTRRIHEQRDLAVRVIGRCVEALIVKKLTADMTPRNVPVSGHNYKLACLTTILGTTNNDVEFLLDHPGATEFTEMVFLALDNLHPSAIETVPLYVLGVVQETLNILSRALPRDWNVAMLLDQTANTSDGSKVIKVETYRTALRVWMKNLWVFTRDYATLKISNSELFPPYICVAFANPEITRRIYEERDLAVRAIGRCVEALVVDQLAVDIESDKSDKIRKDGKLARLLPVFDTEDDHIKLSLSHLRAIEFTKMVFLALDIFYPFNHETVSSDILDVVQQTFSILSLALPSELKTDTLNNLTDGTSSLTIEMYRNMLRLWMENLWRFTKACNLPSFLLIAFSSPEMTGRIRQEPDLTVRVIGRCVEALVVCKLTTDIKSRNAYPHELACLSGILGTNCDSINVFLKHPGAIEFTNMIFLALDDIYSFTHETLPLYVVELVQETFNTLSRALPPVLLAGMRPGRLIDVSESTSSLTAAKYRNVLRMWMINLWCFARECNRPENSVPLPRYICVAFANPEMTCRLREERDLAVRVIGRCIQALVVKKLTTDIKSCNGPVNARDGIDDSLECLSAILGTENHEASLCLDRPGTIELLNLASLALGDVSSLRVDQMPPDTCYVLQETFTVLSQTLTSPLDAGLLQDRQSSVVNVSDEKYESTIVPHLDGLLKMCVSGAFSFVEEVRTSHLRMKTLWHCAKAYHQISDPLPSYFTLVLARREITDHLKSAQDIFVRITGCCFGALIASKLVDALEPPISLSIPRNAVVACISAILGTCNRDDLLLPHRLHLINFRNVVSLMSSEADSLFTSEGMPADLLIMAQDTLHVIANSLRDSTLVLGGLPRGEGQLLQEFISEVEHALSSYQLKNETLKTLDRLRQILGKLLPAVESSLGNSVIDRGFLRGSVTLGI